MAAASYTTDLATHTDCSTVTGFAEATGFTATDGPGVADTDLAIYGTVCISESQRKSGLGSLFYTGTARTLPTDGAFFLWCKFFAPNALNTKVLGGLQVLIGQTSANFRQYYVNGSDTYAYGGWLNYVADPRITASATTGAPNTTYAGCGIGVDLLAGISKGNALTVDHFRWGRGQLLITAGDLANGYANFTAAAVVNDNPTTGRWGLLQDVGGSFLWKGLLSLGSAGTATDFRDSNKVLTIENTEYVSSAFNKIDIVNAATNVELNSISITSLSTVSPGQFLMTNNATVTLDSCSFTGMSTFTFLSNLTATGCTWRRCGQITAPGCSLNGCLVTNYTGAADTSSVVWNAAVDPSGKMDDMEFVKGTNSHHAIELGLTSPLTVTFNGVISSGFNAANAATDSFFHVKRTTGTVTINLVGTTGNFSYKTDGATVVLVIDPVTTTVTVRDNTGTLLQNARVYLEAADGTAALPFEDSVSISVATTTATVTHTAHGMANGDQVMISGCNQVGYNGAKVITFIDVNSYSYTVVNDGAATGTIIATGILINELTTAGGIADDTRSIATAQPVVGWVRKSSGAPYFKQFPISGTVSTTVGLSINVQLVLDQ